jgi:outer membrane protein insertion porin family
MKFRVCLARGLGIVALVLGTILLGAGTLSLTTGVAQAQGITVGSIVVQGNQRVEADTIRSYFRPGPGGRLDAFQIDEGVKALYSTG